MESTYVIQRRMESTYVILLNCLIRWPPQKDFESLSCIREMEWIPDQISSLARRMKLTKLKSINHFRTRKRALMLQSWDGLAIALRPDHQLSFFLQRQIQYQLHHALKAPREGNNTLRINSIQSLGSWNWNRSFYWSWNGVFYHRLLHMKQNSDVSGKQYFKTCLLLPKIDMGNSSNTVLLTEIPFIKSDWTLPIKNCLLYTYAQGSSLMHWVLLLSLFPTHRREQEYLLLRR